MVSSRATAGGCALRGGAGEHRCQGGEQTETEVGDGYVARAAARFTAAQSQQRRESRAGRRVRILVGRRDMRRDMRCSARCGLPVAGGAQHTPSAVVCVRALLAIEALVYHHGQMKGDFLAASTTL